MRVVEYRDRGGSWHLCLVVAEKFGGVISIQIPNPYGFGWRIDLQPGEYTEVKNHG